jgi:hypothetical protein
MSYNPHQPPPQPTRQFSAPPPYAPPGPPPYGTPPQQMFPPPPAKKRRPWLWAGVGVLALLSFCAILGAIGNLAGSDPGTTAQTAGAAAPAAAGGDPAAKKGNPKPAKPKAPGLNTLVRDGKFEFAVTGMDCSKSTLGEDFMTKKAQGKFCVVDVTVRNIGKEAQMFAGFSQKAFDAAGSEFTNDGAAEFYANDNNETFLNEINPGNQVKGRIVFDVPKGTTLTTLELHDSAFSGGVKVALK